MFPIDYKKARLVLYPNRILRTNCDEVPKEYFGSEELLRFCKFMKRIANKYDGIGLAAPQVGINARMVYIAPNSHEQFFLINPKIVEESERQVLDTEGCLSLPNIYGTVIRPEMVVVQAFDEHGNQLELEVDKLTSRVIQHEIDHIDGVLFIDKLVTLTDGEL